MPGKDFKNKHLARWAVEGVRLHVIDDFTWSCITSPWWLLLVLVVATYVMLAFLFAIILTTLAGKGALEGDLPEGMAWFEGCFWFSLANLLTNGFSKLTPASRFGYCIATMLQLVGMLLSALLLGFIVTQAMTPQAKILMSKVGIMRYVSGKQQLVLRGGNVRGVFLAMPELRLCYVHETTMQGCTYFMEEPMPLPPKVALHPGFEVVYDIQPGDYLHGKTKEDMIAEKGFFGLVITGMDEYTCQTVQTIEAVFAANICWNARFEDFRTPQKQVVRKRDEYTIMKTVNFNKLEGVVLLPPSMWPSHLPPLPSDQYDGLSLHKMARWDLSEQLRQAPSGVFSSSLRPSVSFGGINGFWSRGEASQEEPQNMLADDCDPDPGNIAGTADALEDADQLGPLQTRGWSVESAGYSSSIRSMLASSFTPPALSPHAAATAAKHSSVKGAINVPPEPSKARPGWRDFLRRRRSSWRPALSKSFSATEPTLADRQGFFPLPSTQLHRRTMPAQKSGSPRSAKSGLLEENNDASGSVERSVLSGSGGHLSRIGIVHARSSKSLEKHRALMEAEEARTFKQARERLLNSSRLTSAKSSPLQSSASLLLHENGASENGRETAEQSLFSEGHLSRIGIVHARSSKSLEKHRSLMEADEAKAASMLRQRSRGGHPNGSIQSSLNDRLNSILTLNITGPTSKGDRLQIAESS